MNFIFNFNLIYTGDVTYRNCIVIRSLGSAKMGHKSNPYKKAKSAFRWKWKKKRTRRLQRKRRKMRMRSK